MPWRGETGIGPAPFGCDFASRTSRKKPIVLALGSLHSGRVLLARLERLESLDAFAQWLQQPARWVGGFDLPFGLPRELVESLGVTGVTIRNDLANLEKKRVLIRARGGAIRIDQHNMDEAFPLSDKTKTTLQEKREIGNQAAERLEDGHTIITDSGSPTFDLAQNLQ